MVKTIRVTKTVVHILRDIRCSPKEDARTIRKLEWKTAKNLQQKIFFVLFFCCCFYYIAIVFVKRSCSKETDCQNIQAFLLIPTVCLIRSNVTICFFNHSYIDFFQQTTTLIFQSTKICFSGFRFNKFTVCK